MQLRSRIIITLLPVLLPVVGFGWMEYHSQSEQLRTQLLHDSKRAASSARMQLNTLMRVKHEEFEFLAQRLYACHDHRSLDKTPERLSQALNHASGFSALVLSDTRGEVLDIHFAAHGNNAHILPRMFHNEAVLAQPQRKTLLSAYREWQWTRPIQRRYLEQLRNQASAMVKRGEQLSRQYRELQHELTTRSRNLELPPVLISLGGKHLVQQMGLPFRGDTYMYSFFAPDCAGLLEARLVTVFMDRSQLEAVLYRARLELVAQGYKQLDVVLTDRDGTTLFSDAHFLAQPSTSTASPVHTGFSALEPVVDAKVLDMFTQRSTRNENFWQDHAYEQLVDDHSSMAVMVYIADAELSMRLERLWGNIALWMVAGILLLLLLILRVARNIVQPVQELEQHLQGVAKGEQRLQMVRHRRDEFGRLADAFNDMTEKLAEKEQSLVKLATTDPLTGLLNRRAFADAAEQYRRKGVIPVVMLLDLDHFKAVNDSYGHSAGDRVLSGFATILQECVAGHGLAGRMGGEEFMVLLNDAQPDFALNTAERIRSKTEQCAFESDDGAPFYVTVSIGLANWQATLPLSQAISCADKALYCAKSAGRNQLHQAESAPALTS